jgi:hypothetical protein
MFFLQAEKSSSALFVPFQRFSVSAFQLFPQNRAYPLLSAVLPHLVKANTWN